MMDLTLLGTGTPWPCVERQGTANLLRTGRDTVLIDAGRGATTQLAKIGVHPRDIDCVLITHHHFDHIACLDDLLLAAWNDGRTDPVRIYGPDGTSTIIDHLFDGIYARDIAFRLKEAEILGLKMPDIRDVVQVTDIKPGEKVVGNGWNAQAHQVVHGHDLGIDHAAFPCFGYRISDGQKTLAISGDTIDCAGVRALAQGADLLVQCCYLAEVEVDTRIKRILSDQVLASASQANRIARAAQVKRMVLTHLAPKNPDMLEQVLQEAGTGLEAGVILGSDLMTLTV